MRGRVDHHAVTNPSSNMMANWVFASHHSRSIFPNLVADNCRVTEKAGLALGEVFTDCPFRNVTSRRALTLYNC